MVLFTGQDLWQEWLLVQVNGTPLFLSVASEFLHVVSPAVSSQTYWCLGAAGDQDGSCL